MTENQPTSAAAAAAATAPQPLDPATTVFMHFVGEEYRGNDSGDGKFVRAIRGEVVAMTHKNAMRVLADFPDEWKESSKGDFEKSEAKRRDAENKRREALAKRETADEARAKRRALRESTGEADEDEG